MPLSHQYAADALGSIEKDALIRLVYVSKITIKSRLQPSVFDDIEEVANTFNKENDITGTLCYGNGAFLQCLEGSKHVIIELVDRIAKDIRHKEVRILLVKPIKERSFFKWSMRMVFLERWLWSPGTKKQAEQLSEFIPFKPYKWDPEHTDNFLSVIQKFETPPHVKAADITFNAVGNMLKHVAGPHQAFILIQGVLSIFVIIGLILLFKTPFF